MMSNVMLTERDTRLFYDCYNQVALSISQIRKKHFPDCGKATALNRLSKLKKDGYLRSQRIGIVIYQGMPQKIGAVYQITRQELQYLRSRYPNDRFREEPVALNTGALSHDLLLTDVITALKQKYPGKTIVRGQFVTNIEGTKRIPDAVILDTSGKPIAAIELELTTKSNERYRAIVLQYRLSRDFEKVLYITADYATEEKLKAQIIQGKPSPFLPMPSTGKFYFAHLHDLLRDTQLAKITNGTMQFE